MILDKDLSALVSREGTFKPIVVVEGHAFMQLHVNKPRGRGMTLVFGLVLSGLSSVMADNQVCLKTRNVLNIGSKC